MTTFDVKVWRKTRPESAKGKGVAEAITAVDKALKKKPSLMTTEEAKAADAALENLRSKLGTAKSAINDDKKNKDRSDVLNLIEKWVKECKTETDAIAGALGYTVKLAKVQEMFDSKYNDVKDKVDKVHIDAKRHHDNGTMPTDNVMQNYLAVARDAGKVCSTTFYKEMGISEGKFIKPDDVVLPRDMATTQSKIKDLIEWGVEFSKEGKRAARGQAANLDDNVAVEKAIKAVMAAYAKTEADMKQIIKRANANSETATTLATRIKTEIDKGNADEKLFTQIAKALKLVNKALTDADEDMIKSGEEWRSKESPTGKLVQAVKKTAGYVPATHDKVMVDRMQVNQMLIRRVTLPVSEGKWHWPGSIWRRQPITGAMPA